MATADPIRPSPSALGLLDLPAPWLEQLLQEVQYQEDDRRGQQLVGLFRACTTFRDLVLSLYTLRLAITCPLRYAPSGAQDAAQAKLSLACQRSSCIKLVLEVDEEMDSDEYYDEHGSEAAEASTSSCTLLQSVAAARAERSLPGVTSVELRGLMLGQGLLPPWLASTCPNMTSLALIQCQDFEPTTSTDPTDSTAVTKCGQLKHLHIKGLPWSWRAPRQDDWEDHLRGLTGLQSLTFTLLGHDFDVPSWLFESLSTVGSQLTKLSYTPGYPRIGVSPQQFPSWFPRLTTLRLPEQTLDDACMEAVLGLQQLTHFEFCYASDDLHSHVDQPCSWKHVGFTGQMDLGAFDRLPLGGIQSLQLTNGATQLSIHTHKEDLSAGSRVAAIIAKCGGLGLGREFPPHQAGREFPPHPTRHPKTLPRVVLSNFGRTTDANLVAALPIVAVCGAAALVCHNSVENAVSLELLAGFEQHLAGVPGLFSIGFEGGSIEPGVWSALLHALPPSVFRLSLRVEMSEAQLTEMCSRACRPVIVEIRREGPGARFTVDGVRFRPDGVEVWEEGWQGRVKAAMAAAGCLNNVLLVVTGPPEPDEPTSSDDDDVDAQ